MFQRAVEGVNRIALCACDLFINFNGDNRQVCLVLDERYDIRSKIVHVSRGDKLFEHRQVLKDHFTISGCPLMMGGDKDCSSKGVIGIHVGPDDTYLLILDPHFIGRAKSRERLQSDSWIKWQNINDFVDSSFYNICLPQII